MADELTGTNFEKLPNQKFILDTYKHVQLLTHIKRLSTTDPKIQTYFNDLVTNIHVVVYQVKEQQPKILQNFSHWLKPLAKEVLDGWLTEAEQLENDLTYAIHLNKPERKINLVDYTEKWMRIYQYLTNDRILKDNVLHLMKARTSQLVDRDIQVIQDYQTQSLIHIPKESTEFIKLTERLAQATQEPLQQLIKLKEQARNYLSLAQALEEIKDFHTEREKYFNQVLMKIDSFAQDFVSHELIDSQERQRENLFPEIEGELIFIEQEINFLKNELSHSHDETLALKERIKGIIEHLDQFDHSYLSQALKNKIFHTHTVLVELLSSLDD